MISRRIAKHLHSKTAIFMFIVVISVLTYQCEQESQTVDYFDKDAMSFFPYDEGDTLIFASQIDTLLFIFDSIDIRSVPAYYYGSVMRLASRSSALTKDNKKITIAYSSETSNNNVFFSKYTISIFDSVILPNSSSSVLEFVQIEGKFDTINLKGDLSLNYIDTVTIDNIKIPEVYKIALDTVFDDLRFNDIFLNVSYGILKFTDTKTLMTYSQILK